MDLVTETVDYSMGKITPSASRGRTLTRCPEHAGFSRFVLRVIALAKVTTSTLLVTVVYIERAKPRLRIASEKGAFERVFLGALIVASKVRKFRG